MNVKLRRVCAKSCQPSRARFLCEHCGENLSSSQFARHKGLNFKESFTWSGDGVSCNSFSVQDPFGSHCSSEDESIDKGIAEDEGWLGNRFLQSVNIVQKFKEIN